MKLVVTHLIRTNSNGDVAGGKVTVSFWNEGHLVYKTDVKGKCLSRYVRSLPDFKYDNITVDCNEATSFRYNIE